MDPLAQLNDIQLPETVSMWPPAYGWWILLLLLVFTSVALIIWCVKRYRLRRPLKQAIAELEELKEDDANWLQQINIISKRAYLAYFPAEAVAGLHGQRWQQFLISLLKPKHYEQLQPLLDALVQGPYRPAGEAPSFADTKQQCQSLFKATLPPKPAVLKNFTQANAKEVAGV